MALRVDVKLAVAKNGTEIGMRKDGDNDFGTIIPNYLGNSMTLVTTAYSDGTDFIVMTDGKVDNLSAISLTSASGATADLAWDGATSAYKGAVGALKAVLASHYDGILELQLQEGAGAPPVVKPDAPAAPTFASITATGAKVNWTAPSGGAVDNYKVHVTKAGTDITGSPFTMAGATLTKTLSGLTASTAYKVSIEAINTAGSSTSPEATLTTIA
jgi:hypothetical protein